MNIRKIDAILTGTVLLGMLAIDMITEAQIDRLQKKTTNIGVESGLDRIRIDLLEHRAKQLEIKLKTMTEKLGVEGE